MSRGHEKGVIFLDDVDRRCFIEIAAAVLRSTGTSCLAWALMPNHFHLLLRIAAVCLSTVMHRINTAYACAFNHRHGRVGPVFQGRFRSIAVQADDYRFEVIRYIHLNPLRGGLVADLGELAVYPWTGHAALMADRADGILDLAAVQEMLPGTRVTRPAAITEYMLQGWVGGERPLTALNEACRSQGVETRHDRADPRRVLEAAALAAAAATTRAAEDRARRRQLLAAAGWTLDSVHQMVCRRMDVSARCFVRGVRDERIARARAVIAWMASRYLGASHAEIARRLGVRRQAVARCIERGQALGDVIDWRGRLARFRP